MHLAVRTAALHAYLNTPVAASLGQTDRVLVVSGTRFPVHRCRLLVCLGNIPGWVPRKAGSGTYMQLSEEQGLIALGRMAWQLVPGFNLGHLLDAVRC